MSTTSDITQSPQILSTCRNNLGFPTDKQWAAPQHYTVSGRLVKVMSLVDFCTVQGGCTVIQWKNLLVHHSELGPLIEMTEVGLLYHIIDLPTCRPTDAHHLPYLYPTSPFLSHFCFPYPCILRIYFISLPTMNSQSFLRTQLRVSTHIPTFVLLPIYYLFILLQTYNRLVSYCGQYSHFYATN